MKLKTKERAINIIGVFLVIAGFTYCCALATDALPPAPCEATQSC